VTREGKSPIGEAPQHAVTDDGSSNRDESGGEKRASISGEIKPIKEIVEQLTDSYRFQPIRSVPLC
jgi:hypothetical protein